MEREFGLEGREVHLWAVQLDAAAADVARFLSYLSTEERTRADRFKFDEHRRNFIVSHGVLRVLLARYANLLPMNIRYSYGPKGKPAAEAAAVSLRFNMAHSGRIAVYALTKGCEIGVDVEHLRPLADMDDIAARFFCDEEARELKETSEPDRIQAFFHCWTRKEAYIKAVGDGLSLPLDQFRVSLKAGEPAQLLSLGRAGAAAERWTMHHFVPAEEYVGAIAYPDAARPLVVRPLVHVGEVRDL
jgi:4'-phosphopantetheinyl transferase